MSFKSTCIADLNWNWNENGQDTDRLKASTSLGDNSSGTAATAAYKAADVALTDTNATNYDLQSLSKSVLGSTVTINFQKLMGICIVNSADSTGDIVIGGAVSNAFSAIFSDPSDEIVIPPGGAFVMSNDAGWTVDATHKALDVTASGGAVEYSIALVGKET